MRPTPFRHANLLLGVPASHVDRGLEPLPVAHDGDLYVSRWEPSDAEREAIAAGAPVWLVVLARSHPPVQLSACFDGGLEAPS